MKNDPFFDAYNGREIAFGLDPSAELASYLDHVRPLGNAIDLGAGAGRNSIALAQAGMNVHAVDLSESGLARLIERATELNIRERVTTEVADVRHVAMPTHHYHAVVATTVLDHVNQHDIKPMWTRIVNSLSDTGVLYAEVHTTEDPGCPDPPGSSNANPVSETAWAVKHYFQPGELLQLALSSPLLRVLRYEERLEWDYTHGPEHQHGKAVLLGVAAGCFPPWYGYPVAFPRR